MQIYEKEFKLKSSDVDMNRRLRTSVLFTMLQEAAIAHTEALGMGREKTLDRGLLWIVTMQRAEIARMPEYDEEIVLRSWPGDSLHLIFPRYFSLTTAAGEPLLKASSLWSLIDANTRSLIFPEKFGIEIPGVRTGDEIPMPSAIRPLPPAKAQPAANRSQASANAQPAANRSQTSANTQQVVNRLQASAKAQPAVNRSQASANAQPAANETAARTFTVPYSCVDLNGHMNNTRYFDLAEDLIFDMISSAEQTGTEGAKGQTGKEGAKGQTGKKGAKGQTGTDSGAGQLFFPKLICTEFAKEVRLGDELKLSCTRQGSNFLVTGSTAKPCFKMRIEY